MVIYITITIILPSIPTMYAVCPDDLLTKIQTIVIDNDRLLYTDYYQTAIDFCVQRDILVGGKLAIGMLTGNYNVMDLYVLDLYTDNLEATAQALADKLYLVDNKFIASWTCVVKTDIPDKEYSIGVNCRTLFRMHALDAYRNIVLKDLVPKTYSKHDIAVSYQCEAMKSLRCLSEEILLVQTYKSLYTPTDKKLKSIWEFGLTTEESLVKNISEGIAGTTRKDNVLIGGATDRKSVDKLFMDLSVLVRPEYILLGEHALGHLGIIKGRHGHSKLQFIASGHIKDILRGITADIQKAFPNIGQVDLSYARYDLSIPADFRLVKHTIFMNLGDAQRQICDVFNSTEYELVPVELSSGVAIGGHWVLLRFLFIELWVLRIVAGLKGETIDLSSGKPARIFSWIQALRGYPHNKFPMDYRGVVSLENLDKKKLSRGTTNYYPAVAHGEPAHNEPAHGTKK